MISLSFISNSGAELIAALKHDMLMVESFYKTRHAIIQQRVHVLHDHYGIAKSAALDGADRLDVEDLTAAFLDLRDAIKKLQWYGLVNFSKILGRIGKFEGGITWPSRPSDLRVPDTQLATQSECLKDLGYVNNWITRLRSESCRRSTKPSLLQQEYYKDLPSPPLITASVAIYQDDALALDEVFKELHERQGLDESTQQRLLFALLHFSILNGRRKFVESLLSSVRSLRGFGDHLHWLIIRIGRRQKLQDRETQIQSIPETIVPSEVVTKTIDQLIYVINRLGSMLKRFLYKRDSFGRLPLHHAVQHGLSDVCQAILKYMKGQDSINPSSALLPDSEGLTPLDIAVLTGNAAITEILLNSTKTGKHVELPGNLLTTALKLDSLTIVHLLRTLAVDINYKGQNDETALYLAVRSGRLEYVAAILEAPSKIGKMDLNATELVYGWTPLILACVEGNKPIMELLLRAGADAKVQDIFGWSAKDHAAFRGYLHMAKVLMALDVGSSKTSLPYIGLQREEQHIKKASPSLENNDQDIPPNYSQIYVNFGSLVTYNTVPAVNMAQYVAPDAYDQQREAEFQVEIRAIDTDQSSDLIQLPVLEDLTNKPWRFLTKNARDFKLAFNIFHAKTVAHQEGQLLGSAVALLTSLKQGLGSKRETLIRDFTIPILHKDTLNFIGTVTFYLVIITPFLHPSPTLAMEQIFRGDDGPTVIGHRGIFHIAIPMTLIE